MNFWFQTRFE